MVARGGVARLDPTYIITVTWCLINRASPSATQNAIIASQAPALCYAVKHAAKGFVNVRQAVTSSIKHYKSQPFLPWDRSPSV